MILHDVTNRGHTVPIRELPHCCRPPSKVMFKAAVGKPFAVWRAGMKGGGGGGV